MADDGTSTASVTLVEGMQFVGETGSGHAVVLDGAPGFGRDTGARPMELLLVGLAGCTGMDVAHILRKQRAAPDALEVRVRARRAAEHPKVYEEIEIEYRARGPGLEPRHLKKAVALSATKFCSASVMLGKTAKLVHRLRIENEDGTWEETLDPAAAEE